MTRQLTEVAQFEDGVLIEVTPHPEYPDSGTSHAYYVPDQARMDAGMAKVNEMESSEEFFDEDGDGYDWETIRELVSAADIVERAEGNTLNRTDGALGNAKRHQVSAGSWRKKTSTDGPLIPQGVVKFADPDADTEVGPYGDPVQRGRCWGAIQDRVQTENEDRRIAYQEDVQDTTTYRARVPLDVVGLGEEMIAAYLAAHDHGAKYIAVTLDLEVERVHDILDTIAEAA
jgi:hypothetical protein